MTLMMVKFLIFLCLALAFLFGGHYFLYRSLVISFGLDKPLLKHILFTLLLILSLSFIAASFVAHYSHSPLTRFFYLASASWVGLAINLMLAALCVGILIRLLPLVNLNVRLPFFSAGIYIAAIIFSLYGFWNARHPQIKRMTITIEDLPSQWQGAKIVQLSDVHLGRLYGAGFLQAIVSKVNAEEPDLILITGDLFDGMDGGLDVFVKPLDSLRAKKGVFFVTGNHEAYVGLHTVLGIMEKTRIRVLDREVVNLGGLQLVGINYPIMNGKGSFKGILADTAAIINGIEDFDGTKPAILMYHAPVNMAQAKSAGINLQLSGHTHKGQIWPFEFFTWLVYGTYHYGLHSIGDFQIYTTNGVGTWGPPMRSGNTPEIPVFTLQ